MHKCLENINMMKKVVIPATVVLAAAVGSVVLAERGLDTLTAQTHQIINITAKRQSLAFAMTASANGVAASEKNAMLMTEHPRRARLGLIEAPYEELGQGLRTEFVSSEGCRHRQWERLVL
jgi:hypothetical protein